ncbi:MAG: SdrD B-like domain-containing protein [Caldilineaceae bacterium]
MRCGAHQIGNRVWEDYDGDGVQDAGEPGLNGLTVTLQTPTGITTTTTGGDGNYYFAVDAYIAYTITVATPDDYSLTAANAGALDAANLTSNDAISDTIDSDALLVNNVPTIRYTTGGPGQNNHGLDFGFVQPVDGQVDILNTAPALPAQFGDRVFLEDDGDGYADTGDITPIAGMVITATNGTEIYTTTTNAAGYYSFTVPGDTYTVTYGSVPAGYGVVVPSTVISGTSESGNAGSYAETGDPDANHGQHTVVTVAAGETNWQVDFAFTPVRYSLGNRLWIDDGAGISANRNNGRYDIDESAVAAGVRVDLQTITGTVVATTTTDAAGYYRFDRLLAGTYRVHIPASEFQSGGLLADMSSSTGLTTTFTTGENNLDHGDDDTSDGVTSAIITLGADNPTGDVDGGVIGAGANGTSGDANDNLTVDFGFVPLLVVSIGNQVWKDGNDNGLYDLGEEVIPDLLMELWLDVDGDGVAEPLGDDGLTAVLTTTTNASGQYSFTNLLPDTYFVRIPIPPPVTPLSSIPLSSPDNGVDNDDNGDQPAGPNTQILSPVVNLTAGAEPGTIGGGNYDYSIDFGLVDPFLGNLVWHDINNNGLVDPNEPGIAGVIVTVLYDDEGNGIDPDEQTPFRTTQTDADGIYVFPDLIPGGNYQVVIPATNFAPGGALEFIATSSDNTATTDNQVDEDDNGIQASAGLTVTSPLVSLTVDTEPVDGSGETDETGRGANLDNGDDNNGDMTIDFGFWQPQPVLTLDKLLVAPADSHARPDDPVLYELVIQNTGNVTLTEVVINDQYDSAYLRYDSASIAPTVETTGELTWTLTAPTAPLPLSVGETMTVTVNFTVIKP